MSNFLKSPDPYQYEQLLALKDNNDYSQQQSLSQIEKYSEFPFSNIQMTNKQGEVDLGFSLDINSSQILTFKKICPKCMKPNQKLHQEITQATETKNIPKNFGVHLSNFIEQEMDEHIKNAPAVRKFINQKVSAKKFKGLYKKENKHLNIKYKNYGLEDFRRLFEDPIGKQIGKIFFGSHYWIQRVLYSNRISDIKLFFKYFPNFFAGAVDPQQLQSLK